MTLKAFKAAVQVGVQITVLDHWLPRCHNQNRTVTKVQGNGYWFTEPGSVNPDGTLKRMWGDFPKKASELRFDGKVAHVCMTDIPGNDLGKKFWVLAIGESA